ncbi:MAG TPA: hypothetical protein VHG53_07930 [Candidatus Limnocylindria bacterium]|nr:hypothetical protein [Candidatus Limnocylindria bacterium]
MLKSSFVVLAAAALLVGTAGGAALAHTGTIGPNPTQRAVVADECGAQGEQKGENEDPACTNDQPGEDASGSNDQGDMEQATGASGATGATGATGAEGQQSGGAGDEQGQHGTDGEQNGDNSD